MAAFGRRIQYNHPFFFYWNSFHFKILRGGNILLRLFLTSLQTLGKIHRPFFFSKTVFFFKRVDPECKLICILSTTKKRNLQKYTKIQVVINGGLRPPDTIQSSLFLLLE
jgi:hypothetical protein